VSGPWSVSADRTTYSSRRPGKAAPEPSVVRWRLPRGSTERPPVASCFPTPQIHTRRRPNTHARAHSPAGARCTGPPYLLHKLRAKRRAHRPQRLARRPTAHSTGVRPLARSLQFLFLVTPRVLKRYWTGSKVVVRIVVWYKYTC
jgi:hypothetical protein